MNLPRNPIPDPDPTPQPAGHGTETGHSTLHARQSSQQEGQEVTQAGEQQGGGGSQVSRIEAGGQGSRTGGDSEITDLDLSDAKTKEWLALPPAKRPREVNEALYLANRREGWSATEACRRAGMSYYTMAAWRTKIAGFRDREAQAEAQGDMSMLDMLKGMALSAEDERNRIRAAEVWLRARLPRIDRVELSGPNGGPLMGIGVEAKQVQQAISVWSSRLGMQDDNAGPQSLPESEQE